MKIDISNLKDGETLELEHSYDAKAIAIEQDDLHYVGPLKLKGILQRVKNSLIFKGKLTGRIEIVCARCLDTIESDTDVPFDLFYTIKNEKVIDTTGDVRETVVLSYPVKLLCRENCKGLCQHCGANLNDGPCKCERNKT